MNCVLMNNILGAPNPALHEKLGTKIHGCDECQLACPRNKSVVEKMSRKDGFIEELKKAFDLEKILLLDDAYYMESRNPLVVQAAQWAIERLALSPLRGWRGCNHRLNG